MTDDQLDTSSTRGGELVLHRPRLPTAGAPRRIQVYLDDQHVADLARSDTAHVVTTEGPHQLSARCPPSISGDHTFILAAGKIPRAEIHISALDEIEIHLDERPRPQNTNAVTAPRTPLRRRKLRSPGRRIPHVTRRMGNLNEWLGPWPVCTTVCLRW